MDRLKASCRALGSIYNKKKKKTSTLNLFIDFGRILVHQAHVYYKSSNDCAAFLANYDDKVDATVTFNGISYFLPAWSVSILPDCKNAIFNTAKVTSQKPPLDDVSLSHNFIMSEYSLASSSSPWSWYKEKIGVSGNNTFVASNLLEQINTTKDMSDFLWYTTR